MNTLYVVKEFGRYHFFKTEQDRTNFLNTLSECEQKFAQTYEVRFGKVA